MTTFEISDSAFLYNGQPLQLISGAIHYFRIVPEYWEDRLRKLKACGLNTVETYVPWNAHEPQPGKFCFDGLLDVVAFIQIAAELDLLVIVRPSPYICAEWDLGGLPAWLLADPGMKLRCMHPAYLKAIDRYYDTLLPLLTPLQCTQGGPVIAMQIENEYGSYGNDTHYLTYLERGMRDRGVNVPLFTSDGPSDAMLQGGTLPHILKTANFGSRGKQNFAKLREYQETGPLLCAEFWNGWFDHWGAPHHTRNADDAARSLDEMLSMGASVNFYMFHGGTNFGFTSGANFDTQYEPTVTSYDYDAPLNEAGDLTPKYCAFREVLSKYHPALSSIPCETQRKANFGKIALTEQALLFANLTQLTSLITRPAPEPMEMLGQNNGFILYRTRISGPRTEERLYIQELHDRALVFLDGVPVGVRSRMEPDALPLQLTIPAEGATLDIFVENMGHINYGAQMLDRKGITEGVRLEKQFLFNWEIFCLPMENLSALRYQPPVSTGDPAFYRGIFEVSDPADTFVALQNGWTKGICFINDFNLGRYWNIEPYRNLYLPGPLLRVGANEIVLFELHGNLTETPTLQLLDHP